MTLTNCGINDNFAANFGDGILNSGIATINDIAEREEALAAISDGSSSKGLNPPLLMSGSLALDLVAAFASGKYFL